MVGYRELPSPSGRIQTLEAEPRHSKTFAFFSQIYPEDNESLRQSLDKV